MTSSTAPSPQEILKARHALWEQSDLSFKLEPTQKDIYSFVKDNNEKIIVINCSRQLGKSFTLLNIAIETCLKHKRAIVKYLCGQQRMVQEITTQIMPMILVDCPPHLKPVYKSNLACWYFPHNGSKIQMAGVDNKRHDRIRGGRSHLCIVDEAAFISELKYTINSVLLPTTTTTGGKIVIVSTPPESPDHDFCSYMEDAEANGAYLKKTIEDCLLDFAKLGQVSVRIKTETIEAIAKALGGRESTAFQREYLCLVQSEETSAIVPEFTAEAQAEIIKDWQRPSHYHSYVAMDIGGQDLTAVLFAYYDFRNDKIVIEDELIMQGYQMTTDKLADVIKFKEGELWKDPFDPKKPLAVYKRVADNNNIIMLNDLQRLHKLFFLPTQKDDSLAALNNLRIAVAQRRLIINPRCETFIRHLRNGKWNKGRTSFMRSPGNGHYDCIDAAKYLLRNIDFSRNPYPDNYDLTRDMSNPFISPHNKPSMGAIEDWARSVFKKKK